MLKLALKNIIANKLSSGVSILLLSFSIALLGLIYKLQYQSQNYLKSSIGGVDMVVGAKGSPLQIILSSIYQIDAPTGNISFSSFKILKKSLFVKNAIPLAFGDRYNNYRIVGTDSSYLTLYGLEIDEGSSLLGEMSLLLGSELASKTGLKIGDEVFSEHGLVEGMNEEHEHPYTVTGILKRSNKVADNLLLTHYSSLWHAHDHSHGDEESEEDLELTSILIKYKSPLAQFQLPRQIQSMENLQAALPAIEVNRLIGLISTALDALKILAISILFISGISIFLSLLKSLSERKFELGLLRVLGASQYHLIKLIAFEAIVIASISYIFGLIFSKALLFYLSVLSYENYKSGLEWLQIDTFDVYLYFICIGLALVSSVIPMNRAYRINLSNTLNEA